MECNLCTRVTLLGHIVTCDSDKTDTLSYVYCCRCLVCIVVGVLCVLLLVVLFVLLLVVLCVLLVILCVLLLIVLCVLLLVVLCVLLLSSVYGC